MQPTFTTTVELGGETATGMRVPPEAVAALGTQKQPLVRVTIGEHTYRSKVAVRGGNFLMPISAENREAAGVAAGASGVRRALVQQASALRPRREAREAAGDAPPPGREDDRDARRLSARRGRPRRDCRRPRHP